MIKSFVFVSAILLFVSCQTTNEKHEDALKDKMFVKAVSFQTSSGWGYEIYVDNKLYIRQAVIPALPGKKSFATCDEALSVGKLVLQKMANEQKMPVITVADLQQLHVREAR